MPYDVIVMGGGPSGSTAANLLASGGARVLVLEKDVFPRFHIGESLLPGELAVFQRLGVDVGKSPRHMIKRGAEFYEEAAGRRAVYPFGDSLQGTPTYAFQVERAVFDAQLLARAAEVGAEVHEGERVRDVELGEHEVVVATERDRYRARYVIDATGLDAFFARKHRTRRRIEDFGLAAVFRHFGDLRPAIAEELARTGNIKVLFVEDGWLWAIPLGQARLSVGLVTRKKGIADEWLDAEIARSPELGRLLEGARPEG
ncbi:MAG TPA: NAD(P)/FAD-dependent oxidoreductase, partial [Sandaracinaceae bacterium]